jgi:hypothetical protein
LAIANVVVRSQGLDEGRALGEIQPIGAEWLIVRRAGRAKAVG